MTDAPQPDRIERLSALAESLAGAPSPTELARLLALRIFDSWGCRGVLIFRPESSGALALAGSFGYADGDAARLGRVEFTPDSGLHRAMSADETQWFPDPEDVAGAVDAGDAIPDDTRGLILMPIAHIGVPVQLIVLAFADPLPSNPASEPFVNAVRSLLELQAGPTRHHVTGEPTEAFTPSVRQGQVLAMLAEGRTNRSIAAELGFSESTIRQETLRLYRGLGVNGRVEAVAAARERGLLPPVSGH